MSKINFTTEILERHTDAEIIEYLYRVMVGVAKNYKLSVEKNTPEILWVDSGDIDNVLSLLQAVHKRNQARLAQTQE